MGGCGFHLLPLEVIASIEGSLPIRAEWALFSPPLMYRRDMSL